MQVSAMDFYKDFDQMLDHVLETGEPLRIERDGRFLVVIPALQNGSKLLVKHECIAGDPEDLVHLSWLG